MSQDRRDTANTTRPSGTRRRDDADARGEHEYGDAQNRNREADSSAGIRVPNSYVAGEHGTQQVTAPRSSRDVKKKPRTER